MDTAQNGWVGACEECRHEGVLIWEWDLVDMGMGLICGVLCWFVAGLLILRVGLCVNFGVGTALIYLGIGTY